MKGRGQLVERRQGVAFGATSERFRQRSVPAAFWRTRCWWLSLVLCWIGVPPGSGPTCASDPFVEALLLRRLDRLAALYCRQRLVRSDLSLTEQGDLTADLIRAQTQGALARAGADQVDAWEQARQTATQFLSQYPEHPRAPVVQLQHALTVQSQGVMQAEEADLREFPPLQEKARENFRDSIRRLEELDKELTATIPVRRRRAPGPDDLAAEELENLQAQTRFELAGVYVSQALSYPPGSSDRVAALTQARSRLEAIAGLLAADHPLRGPVGLRLVRSLRLAEDYPAARERLNTLSGLALPLEMRPAAQAERVQLALAEGEPRRAWDTISQWDENERRASPDLLDAELDVLLTLWQQSDKQNKSSEATAWRDRSRQLVEHGEVTFGRSWGRRATWKLANATRRQGAGGDFDLLRRRAELAITQGQIDEALTAWDQATAQARAAQRGELAQQFAFQAASACQQKRRYSEAATRFFTASDLAETAQEASRAHLLGCWNVAQSARTDPRALDSYAAGLVTHLAKWPDAATAPTARVWQGKLWYGQRRWQQAVRTLKQVPRDHPESAPAMEWLAECWDKWLCDVSPQRESPSNDEWKAMASEARGYLREYLAGRAASAPWSQPERAACLVAAKLGLLLDEAPGDIERQLNQALSEGPDVPPAYVKRVLPWLIAAQSLAPNHEAGELSWIRFDQQPVAASLEVAQTAAFLATRRSNPDEVKRLLDVAIESLDRGARRTSDDQDNLMDQISLLRTQVLAAAGRLEEAVTEFSRLAETRPDDGQIQEQYAVLLDRDVTPAATEKALNQWRLVGSRSRPGTEPWYRAKLGTARALSRLGNRAEAARVLRYLQATSGFPEPPLRDEFVELLKQLEADSRAPP